MPVTVTDALAAACALSLRNVESQLYMLPLAADKTQRAQLEAWRVTLENALTYATGGAPATAPAPVLLRHGCNGAMTEAETRAAMAANRYTVESDEEGEIFRDGQPWLKVSPIAAQIAPHAQGAWYVKGGGRGVRCSGAPLARGRVQAACVALAQALNAAEPVTGR